MTTRSMPVTQQNRNILHLCRMFRFKSFELTFSFVHYMPLGQIHGRCIKMMAY